MNEQNNLQPTEPIQNSKNIWVIVIFVIFITALVVGGGVYAWQRSALKATEKSLQEQVDILQRQIDELSQLNKGNEADQQKPVQTEQHLQEKRIVFLKGNGINDSEAEIWSMSLDGENETKTGINLKTGENFSTFHQSPDLKYACFIDGNQQIGEEVYLYNVEENTVNQVSDSFFKTTDVYDGSWFIDCVWSADSKNFAYRVSHHPHESTEGGGLVQKEKPPKKYEDKMGVFIYDFQNHKLTRVKSNDEVNGVEWLPTGNWLQPQTTLTIADNTYSYENRSPNAKLFVNGNVVYETDYYIGHPSPLYLSPDNKKIVFADSDGVLIVFTVENEKELQKFSNAIVDGVWSKYEWLSNNEILFWQSRAGHKYNNNKGFWYQGDLMILDINTGETKNLTGDGKTYWRM
jgi:hypothetical protein